MCPFSILWAQACLNLNTTSSVTEMTLLRVVFTLCIDAVYRSKHCSMEVFADWQQKRMNSFCFGSIVHVTALSCSAMASATSTPSFLLIKYRCRYRSIHNSCTNMIVQFLLVVSYLYDSCDMQYSIFSINWAMEWHLEWYLWRCFMLMEQVWLRNHGIAWEIAMAGYATQLQPIQALSPSFLRAWSKADFTMQFHKGGNVWSL